MDSMMPLSWNVSIRNGGILDTGFRPRHDERHIIELDIDRALPHKESNCLPGIVLLPKDECAGRKDALFLTWELLNGDETVAKGKTDAKGPGYRRAATGRTLGRFDAMKDTPYRLRVAGTADAALNAVHPRIRVGIDLRRYKGAFASSTLYAMVALACVGSAMLLQVFVVTAYRRIRPGPDHN